MRWLLSILPISLLVACAASDADCNAWLEGRRAEMGLQPGTAAFESCLSAARHRAELLQDKRSNRGP
jgi:hypothetical protein